MWVWLRPEVIGEAVLRSGSMGTSRAVIVALVLAAAPATALAQSAKDKQKAGEKVKQAIAKSQAGEHEAAVALYEEAYKIIPQPLLLSNIGSEYQAMQKPVEALGYFCKYLEADAAGSNAGYVRTQAKGLYIELGGIDDVKDEDVCKPIVKKPPPEPEKPIVETPPVKPDPPPEKPEGPKASPLRWVGVGVGALGVGVFGLGVFYGMKAKSISDDITNHPMNEPWDRDIAQQEADGASYEKKQIYFMIGGGVAIAAGVTMFVLGGPKKSSETGVAIAPSISPDQLGFVAAGRF